jgi:hypothetical protein
MDYLMRFFRNGLVLFLVVGGMLLVLLLTGQGEALNAFGGIFEVYDALGILPYVLIMLILAVLPKRRRKG